MLISLKTAMEYEAVIGLEVHIQVKTKSKMFCRCAADYFGSAPNSHVCPVCLGLPGALPVPNERAIEKCLKLALALNCQINHESKFDRKNYFYPDLSKGYQISQYDQPIGFDGFLEVEGEGNELRKIHIRRVHMEEDTGKSLHQGDDTLLDFNKSGIPLIEVVTEPDFQSIAEVLHYSKRLRQIVRYLEISQADMEKGQMRFELNISLRKSGEKSLPDYKIEVKNIGSISVLEKVIKFEIERQSEALKNGERLEQETRGLRDLTGKTYSQRVKEGAEDYRYFPEPDIPPLSFTDEQISKVKKAIPELPQEKKARFISLYGLEPDTAEILVSSVVKSAWFMEAVEGINGNEKPVAREIAKWLIGDVMALLKTEKQKFQELKFSPVFLQKFVRLIKEKNLPGTFAKQILLEMYKSGRTPEEIFSEKDFHAVSGGSELQIIAEKVVKENPKIVADYAKNPNAIKFLLGKVMQATKGQADPLETEKILKQLLSK